MGSKRALETIKGIVGEDLFARLVDELAGETVYFPSNYEWQDKEARNISLKEDYYSGSYEISDLARKYDLSISRVYKIIQHRD